PDVDAVHHRCPEVRPEQPGGHGQSCCLPGPVGTYHAVERTCRHIQAEAVDGDLPAKALGQPTEGEGRNGDCRSAGWNLRLAAGTRKRKAHASTLLPASVAVAGNRPLVLRGPVQLVPEFERRPQPPAWVPECRPGDEHAIGLTRGNRVFCLA